MNEDYERIERAIHLIRSNLNAQPSLEEIASRIGLSPFHFQRLFRRWAGVSPKRFLEYLTVAYAKGLLRKSNSILEVSHELGLTGAGRLHDHFVSIEAMTPGEYKTRGLGLQVRYGIHDSPFGSMLLARTDRGVCALAFVGDETIEGEIEALRNRWPNAEVIEDRERTAELASKIFNNSDIRDEKIHLTVRGTNFQVNVWKALLKIPLGSILSYQQLAGYLGKPTASRAVAAAIASNPVGFLIPCHRVLRGTGELSGYHWGVDRKHAMIAWEAAKKGLSDDGAETTSDVVPQVI